MPRIADAAPRVFFAHVMKTGGTTLREHLFRNHAPHGVYPNGEIESDLLAANRDIGHLLGQPMERLRSIRVFTGHFPFYVSRVLARRIGEPIDTITILREPVSRVLSHLRHVRRYHDGWENVPFAEIYDNPYLHAFFFTDYQTRLFSFTEEDAPGSQLVQLQLDDRRLELAKAQLEQVDHIGLREQHDDLVERLRRAYGWREIPPPADRRVSTESWVVPDSLIERIERDNRLDAELYDHARTVVRARGTAADAANH